MTTPTTTAATAATDATDATGRARALLHSARRAVEAYGRDDLAVRLDGACVELDGRDTHVVVVGEFKQGKSSLVNALLGVDVCPVDDDVATAVPTFVRYGDEPAAWVVVESAATAGAPGERRREPIGVGDVRRWVVEGAAAAGEHVMAVEVAVPRSMLRSGLVVVDTPGVGGLGSSHAAASLGAISMADALIFVTDAAQELTRTELDFLRQAVELCPTAVCALTKRDFYPAWRTVLRLDEEHLRCAGLDIAVHPVSAPLRERAVRTSDRDLNEESGYRALVRFVTDRVAAGAAGDRAEGAALEVGAVCDQLIGQFEAERAAVADPAAAQRVIDELTATKERADALRSAAARWNQTLADGIGDLNADIDHDMRARIRRVIQEADDAIDAGDPADTWSELGAWLDSRMSYEMVANYTYLRERAAHLSGQVAEHFVQASGQVLDQLAVYNPTFALSSTSVEHDVDLRRMSIGKQTMIALRNTYGGVLMFTMLGSMAHLALGPLSVVIGLVMGRKGLRDEKQRQLQQRRAQAKNAVRRYCDEVSFVMSKDSRDTLRRIQRQLRDHYAARAEELNRSTSEALARATESAKQTQGERDRRLRDIDAELKRLRELRRRVDAFVTIVAPQPRAVAG
jgi:hypothetical protein